MSRETFPDGACRDGFGRPGSTRPIAVTAADEHEFQEAMTQYKRQSGRQFPTWSEILEILCSLGYAKRIWPEVATWTPLAREAFRDDLAVIDPGDPVGWFARVEIPVGPFA